MCVKFSLGLLRKTIALTLHTCVLSITFAMKSYTNPTRHIFPWLTGEAVDLHTGVLSKSFAIKSCTNPTRHIFAWLRGEAVGLHTGVLTKTFMMSVLYLKTILNCGLGAINGEDASKAGGHGSQRARFLVSLRGVQLARFPVSLRIGVQLARLPFSQPPIRMAPPSH